MKKNLLKSLLVAAGLLASANVVAASYDFKVGDIYYNITSKENRTVEVTSESGGIPSWNNTSDYSGDLVFPDSVTYNDTTYSVKAVGMYALYGSTEITSVTIPASIDTIRFVALYCRNAVIPHVKIDYSDKILVCGGASISEVDSLYINRGLSFYYPNGWAYQIAQATKCIEFGDSVSVIPALLTNRNSSLKEVKFPNRAFTFDVYNSEGNGRDIGIFSGCTALEKVDLSNLQPARSYYEWVDYDNGGGAYNGRTGFVSAYFIPPMTFKGCTALKEVILPDTLVYMANPILVDGVKVYDGVNAVIGNNYFIGASAFEGCSALESITFPVAIIEGSRTGYQWIGTCALMGSGLKSVELPNFISYLGKKAFSECPSLESVTLPTAFESQKPRGDYQWGYYDSFVTGNNYFLSENVFGNCPNLKTVDFGSAVTVVVPNAFAGSKVENLKLKGVSDIQNGNFSSQYLSSIEVDENNTAYKFEDNILKTYDGKQWLFTTGKNYTGATVLKNDTVEMIGTQLFDGLPIESYDFPMLKTIGYRAFANTNLKKADINATVGIYDEEWNDTVYYAMTYGEEAFADCKLLEEYLIDTAMTTLPKGIFKNCELLTETPKILETFKSIPANIFFGTGIKEFTFGEKVDLVCESAMPNGTTDITIYASIPPTVVESDEAEYISNVTLVVPSACVDAYAAHGFWGRAKEIAGNEDFEGHGWSGYIEPAPNGLYFAEKDGNICYFDTDKKEVVDTYIPAGSHTFQLASWHGAIYGVNAGEQYYYVNDENDELGDGELYVVNKRETGFSKSTVVNNKNRGDGKPYQAFLDPYHILIDNDSIYYTNRSFNGIEGAYSCGVKMLPAKEVYDEPYMTSEEVPLFARGDFLPYYAKNLSYGARHAGFQCDSEGVYWHALTYNGYGIYRYKQSDIYYDVNAAQRVQPPYSIIAEGSQLSAMFLDEKNDYIYVFSTNATNHGVYRMPISTIRNGGKTNFPAQWELIDKSPASPENNTGSEGVYVRQFTSDGNYIYWAYIAEEGSGNKSGIKRVNATGTPMVEYVVEDVEAYGICYYEYDGSRSPSVVTKEQTATFAIPRVDNATVYTLNIYYDAEKTQLAKTVHYDETGKIITMSDYIELTIEGFENGEYYYDVVAKSESGEILNSYTGSFEIEYTGVGNVSVGNNAVEVARYDIYGRKLNEPINGVNVVKYSDGTTRKELVK